MTMDQYQRLSSERTITDAILSAGAIVFMAGTVLTAYQGGIMLKALIAALSGVLATAILTLSFTGRFLTLREGSGIFSSRDFWSYQCGVLGGYGKRRFRGARFFCSPILAPRWSSSSILG